MNEQLKFSWGHIVAFVALIFIGYTTFVGMTYLTNGNFLVASIVMAVAFLLFLLFFIGAQVAKATTRKFKKIIWIERVLVFGSPLVFIVLMYPYCHFWTVHSNEKQIVNNFTSAISSSKQMFVDYEVYANARILNYDGMLAKVIANKATNANEFSRCGFTGSNTKVQRANMVQTLRLQLLSVNYDSLKVEANKWIEQSNKGASTWNVFLLGNTKSIRNAIHSWNEQLQSFSKNKLSNEERGGNRVRPFDGGSLDMVDKGLDGLTSLITGKSLPNVIAIITAIVLYFALLFPYILQDRHTKSLYKLIGVKSGTTDDDSPVKTSTNKDISLDINDVGNNSKSSEEDDGFGSFNF